MIHLSRYFEVGFADLSITDLLTVTQDHLSRLASLNTNAQFDDLLTATSNLFERFGGTVSQEVTSLGIQKARTRSKDTQLERIFDAASKLSASLHARFSKDSDVYLKFFPRGVSELRRARGAEVLPLLDRIIQALEEHLPDKLAAWKELREKWRALYVSASEGKSTVRSSAGSRAGAVEELQIQLTRNLLQLAAHFIGQPEKAGEAFDIGLVTPQPRRDRSGVEETQPAASTLREVKPSTAGATPNGNAAGSTVELAV